MVVALAMIIFLKHIGHFSSGVLVLAAFIGSLLSTGFYLTDVAKDSAYGITFGRWYHDRIYLLGDY